MDVVIVESPAKAKTINKYLGSNYQVIASYGHIRDLPKKNGSVRPDQDFAMDWDIEPQNEKHIKAIQSLVYKADKIYLATDPDREGEAIAWHVLQELTKRGSVKNKTVQRVTFNEITKTAVTTAIQNPRDIDQPLVDAYMARRALDYLVGFTISPVLWRKLPGSKSAGRVQSVALRLVCERENEIESFKNTEYWSVEADFKTQKDELFTAKLTTLDGQKITQYSLKNEAEATSAANLIKNSNFTVGDVERKTVKRSPSPPFTTSTLQQEAARKLMFPAKKTMQLAQQLYEGIEIGGETVGLITYMRTDGIAMAQDAIDEARAVINEKFGKDYLPDSARHYKNNVKNAQEAHEAIRPTSLRRFPSQMAAFLTKDQKNLYELIYKRAIACQMENALLDKVGIDCVSDNKKTILRATGQTVAFDGFLKVYHESLDDGDDENNTILPQMNTSDALTKADVRFLQHFTQPPPRYSEASLVKKLEELGIGRPSTYATILSVLQEREYVRLEKRRFIPEDRGRIVTVFMEAFFNKYVQYDFTADLENALDDISAGKLEWKKLLSQFWTNFIATVKGIDPLKISDILSKLETALSEHLFPDEKSRICPECGEAHNGRLSLKLGKFGAFIGCSNYPRCRFTKPFGETINEDPSAPTEEPDRKALGTDPTSGEEVFLRKGPYGYYVQLGDTQDNPLEREIKRMSLPKNMAPNTITLAVALGLLNLPRVLGNSPETNEEITVGLGKFGPYVKIGTTYKSLEPTDNILTIELPRALELLKSVKQKKPAKDIGKHPDDKKVISIGEGRFGPYIRHGKVFVSIPKEILAQNREPTLEEAIKLLAPKEEKAKAEEKEAKKAAKEAAKKTKTKKATTSKKAATTKTTVKKAKK